MVFKQRAEEKVGAFEIHLPNTNFAVESDKHRDKDICTAMLVNTHICAHTPDVFLLSGHRSYCYSSLTRSTGSRGDVNRPRACQEAGCATKLHTYKHRSIHTHVVETCQTV